MNRLFFLIVTLLLCLIVSPVLSEMKPSESQAKREEAVAGQLKKIEILQGEQLRTFSLYFPKNYQPDQKMPVLLAFQGYLMSSADLIKLAKLKALSDKEGIIIAAPQGEKTQWNAKAVANNDDRDTDFVRSVLQYLNQHYAIDNERVYAVGFSNGGFFVHRLACELSEEIAAYGSVASTIGIPLSESCQPKRPTPFIMINGKSDPVITWEGQIERLPRFVFRGSRILPVMQTSQYWAAKNECSLTPEVSSPVKDVERFLYTGCQEGADVELWSFIQDGHSWPGSPSGFLMRLLVGKTNQDVDATQVMWDFMKRYKTTSVKSL